MVENGNSSMQSMLKLRKHIEEIIPLSEDEFNVIASYFSPKQFLKGAYVFQQGDKFHIPILWFQDF